MKAKQSPGKPTPEQLRALQLFAMANGRTWKDALRLIWYSGAYDNAVLGGAEPCYLQQVRNSFGPCWLIDFRLPMFKVATPGGRWKRFVSLEDATAFEAQQRARTGVFAAIEKA